MKIGLCLTLLAFLLYSGASNINVKNMNGPDGATWWGKQWGNSGDLVG